MFKNLVLVLGFVLTGLLGASPAQAVTDTCSAAIAIYTADGYNCVVVPRGCCDHDYHCTGHGTEFNLFPHESGCTGGNSN